MFKALPILGLLLFAAPAEAHRYHRYHNHYHHHYNAPGASVWFQWGPPPKPRQPKVRMNRNCVYKPWKDKVVCKY